MMSSASSAGQPRPVPPYNPFPSGKETPPRPLATHPSRPGETRRDNAPTALARRLATLPAGLILQGQVETVALRILRAR
jgi:hypothetical protein